MSKFKVGDEVVDLVTGIGGTICSENNGYYAFNTGSCTIGFFTADELEQVLPNTSAPSD